MKSVIRRDTYKFHVFTTKTEVYQKVGRPDGKSIENWLYTSTLSFFFLEKVLSLSKNEKNQFAFHHKNKHTCKLHVLAIKK